MRTRVKHRQLAVGTAQVVPALTQQVSFMREALPHSPPYPDNLISISFGQAEDNSDSDKENPFFQAFASENGGGCYARQPPACMQHQSMIPGLHQPLVTHHPTVLRRRQQIFRFCLGTRGVYRWLPITIQQHWQGERSLVKR